MPTPKLRLILLLLTAIFATATSGRAQLQLTGITAFSTDMDGNIISTASFNTFGGDSIFNIYVIDDPVAATFINSGDTGGASPPTGISISLALGALEFFCSVDPGMGSLATFYGLNLFFNGNNATPGISAYTTIDTPTGVPNGGLTLANTGGFTTVPGANTLTFNDPSGATVVLTAFNYASTAPAGLPTDFPEDLVGPFSVGPNMIPDNYLDFTLTVVPEPSTWALLALGSGALLWQTRRRLGR